MLAGDSEADAGASLNHQNADSDSGVRRVKGSAHLTSESAKVSMLLNLAGAYAANDDLVKANACLNDASAIMTDSQHHSQCVLLGIYVQLRQGNRDAALAIAKQHRINPLL